MTEFEVKKKLQCKVNFQKYRHNAIFDGNHGETSPNNLPCLLFFSGWLATFQAFKSERDQRLMSLIAVEIIFRSTEIYPKRKISPRMHHKAQESNAKVK